MTLLLADTEDLRSSPYFKLSSSAFFDFSKKKISFFLSFAVASFFLFYAFIHLTLLLLSIYFILGVITLITDELKANQRRNQQTAALKRLCFLSFVPKIKLI